MLTLPKHSTRSTSEHMTDVFKGYNHNLRIGEGEWYDTHNLSGAFYPMMANRTKRSTAKTVTAPQGMIEKDALAYIDNGTLYYNGAATNVTGLTTGMKQLVSMGAYILIFPDKKYYNTQDGTDSGSMEASWSVAQGSVTYTPCSITGSAYTPTVSTTAPVNPSNGDTWVDISATPHVLKQYAATTEEWVEISSTYTKLTFTTQGQLPALFDVNDGVSISGTDLPDALDGEKIIYAIGGVSGSVNDYIVIAGMIDVAFTATNSVTIKREVPDMDFMCECQNRIWGCYYGRRNGENVNEIYCCALGDFKNWNRFEGISTDSYAASVGSDGQWTGAINFLGSPLFFKENHIHTVTVSASGAHQIADTPCRGVQRGSAASLAIVNEQLFYKSRSDVCVYQGGFPQGVSEELGGLRYSDAVAGAFGDRYYISMKDSTNHYSLFCYDTAHKLWYREDGTQALSFAAVDDSLYCMTAAAILDLNGITGTVESSMQWYAESGLLYYAISQKKYVSRYNLRLRMERGAAATLYIEYDSSGVWENAGTIQHTGTGTFTLPVRPHRCDHLRFKLVGSGDVRIFSITRIVEASTDI